MFAQVARFKTKKDSWTNVENEITSFRKLIKTKRIPIKQEIVLRNRDHNTWIAIALFNGVSDLEKGSKHRDAQDLLEKVKPHVDGDVELFWSEVF
jgi:hypothetical protein